MSRRNNPMSYLWWIFIMVFFFGSGIVGAVFPLIIIAFVVLFILGKVNNVNKANDPYSTYRNRQNTSYTYTQSRKTSYTPAQLSAVNVYLRKYFQSHAYLPVLADIDLRIHGKVYTSLSSLDVYRHNEYVCSLNDFGKRYPDMYTQILKGLVSRTQTSTSGTDIFDAEVVTPAAATTQTAAPKPEPTPEPKPEPKKTKQAKDFLDEINALNADIPDKEITDGLYETCALLKQIHTLENKFPACAPKLEKLYQYYLPILVNVLKQYDNLQVARTDPSYEKIRNRLNSTLKMINEAMKKIISGLTDSDFINLSADMSTLEAVLQKDGLASSGMNAEATEDSQNQPQGK